MKARAPLWLGLVGLLVLTARWLAYALAEQNPLGGQFEAAAGGPSLVVVTLVSLGLAGAVATAALWLVATGVRERARLQPDRELPALNLRRLVLRAAGLAATGSLGFALLESYLHWGAGLGVHGLSCLVGPVHRNALPLLAALALLAAALAEAAAHLHAWLHATVRALLRPCLVLPACAPAAPSLGGGLCPGAPTLRARPRAPPLLA
jgi:hypothetical protein